MNVLAVFITALMGIMAFGHGSVTAQPQVCNAPVNVRVNNITTTTANVTWQRTGPPQNVCGWMLEYRITSNNPNDPWTTITLVSNPTSFMLFDLLPNTNYEARVRTFCCNQQTSPSSTIISWRTATDCDHTPNVGIQLTNPPFLPGRNNNFTATVPSTGGNYSFRWYLRSNPNLFLSNNATFTYAENVVPLNDALCLSVTWSEDCEPIVNCLDFNTLVPVCDEMCNNAPPVPAQNAVWVNNANITQIAPNPVLNNADVWVSGTLTMNQNRTLNTCRFVMLPNSRVVQNANITTNANGSVFVGCNGIWQGIQLNNPSRWNSANQGNTRSLICSANQGITFGNNSITNLVNTDFFDNNTGLAGQNHTTNLTAANGFLVAGCNFTRFVRGTDGIVISDNTPINTPVAYPNIRIGDLPGNSPRFNNFTDLTNDGIVIAPAAVSSVSNLIDIQWASMVRCRYGVNIQGNQRVTPGTAPRNTLVRFMNMNNCERGINLITNANVTAIWNQLRNMNEAGIWSGGANGAVTITNNMITNTPTGEMCIFVGSISASLTDNNTLTISNNNPLDFGRRGILVDSYIGGLITITQNSLTHIGNNTNVGINGFTGLQGIRVYNDQGDNAIPSGANAFIGNNNITFNQPLPLLVGTDPALHIATGIMVSSLTGRIRVGQETLLGPTAPNVISFNNNYRGVGIDLTQPSSASTSWVIGNTINGPTHTGIRTVGINSPNITCNNVVLSNIGLLPNPYAITNPGAPTNQFTPAQINVGIDVSSSTGAFQVDGNSVTGDPTVLTANRFSVGINMTNNPNLVGGGSLKQMTCNALVDLHTGIRFSGNNFWSNMTNNDMRNNQWGMWFDNLAIVGPQGGLGNPPAVNDNTWLNANGQSTRVMSSNQTNSQLNQPFWFRSTNPNLFSPLFSDIIGGGTRAPFFIVNTNQVQIACGFRPVCLNPGNTLVTPGGYLSIRPQLEHIALAAPDPSDEIAVASDFTAKQTLYNYLHTVSLLRDSSVILHDAYDSLKVSNIAKIWKVDSLITAGDTLTARAVNTGITPYNIMEQNYKTANAVLLKTVCSSADSSAVGGAPHCLTGNCVSALRPVANQCVYKGGQGVYLARTLLALRDTEIRDYDDNCWYNNLLLPKQTQVSQANGEFKVYPNPAKDYFNLSYHLPTGLTEAKVQVSDLLGRTVYTTTLSENSGEILLNTESWVEGMYVLKISNTSTFSQTFKIAVTR